MAVATDRKGASSRIGLLGGSFDPVHNAHLELARAALGHLGLDALQFVPAAAPWQRQPLGASAVHRVKMLQLAIDESGAALPSQDHAGDVVPANPAGRDVGGIAAPSLQVNTIEIDRGGPTYTIDTLRAMGAGDAADIEYFWVLGSDQLVNFCTWHEWREIVRRVRLAVAARPGSQLQPAAALTQELNVIGHPLHILPFDAIDISATAIRRKVAQGQAISGLTPPSVAAYIKTNHLYQAQ